MGEYICLKSVLDSLKETFFYNIKITKKYDKSEIHLKHKNLLFSLEIKETKMFLSTRYLSPSMYILNLIKPYEKNFEGYYVVYEEGFYVDNTKKCIEFDSDKIPIDYVIISRLFSFLKNNNFSNIKEFDIIPKKNVNLFDYENKKKLSKIEYKKCWKDFMNYNGSLIVHDKRWITYDLSYIFGNIKPISEFAQNVFDKINESMKKGNLSLKYDELEYHNEISGVFKAQGGINLTLFLKSFGYSHLFDQKNLNCGDILIRSSGYLYPKTSTDNAWNNYYCDNSDFQSVVILNEFIKSEGIKTTLICHSETDTNQNTHWYSSIVDYVKKIIEF